MPRKAAIGLLVIIGGAIFTIGLGFIFYNVSGRLEERGVIYLTSENSYTYNETIYFNKGDITDIYIRSYNTVNLTCNILDENGTVVSQAQVYLNNSLSVNFTAPYSGEYLLIINSTAYTTVKLYFLTFLSSPNKPYFLYGCILIILSSFLLAVPVKTLFKKKEQNIYFEEYEPKEIILILVSVLPISFTLLFLTQLLPTLVAGNFIPLFLILLFSVSSLALSYVVTSILKGKKLLEYSWLLLFLALMWSFLANFTFSNISSQILDNVVLMDPNIVYVSEYWLDHLDSVFFQLEIFILLIHTFYSFLSVYENMRAREHTMELITGKEEDVATIILRRKLKNMIAKKKIHEFFEEIKKIDIEASGILLCLLKDSLNEASSFTYNRLITDYNEFFSKNLYERKPVERVLAPLELVKITGEKIKHMRLNTEKPEVKKLINIFKQVYQNKEDSLLLEKAAGLDQLKIRKEKFTSQS
ncbi:MAG: hypothetical protein ACTSSJ_06775 [Candidatus Odinarchaeia archaeon]